MGAIVVLTPLVVASWPALASAIAGAAASMGFALESAAAQEGEAAQRRKGVEVEIENSAVLAEQMERGKTMVITQGDLRIEIGQDDRGGCRVCVTGGRNEREMRAVGEEVAGRIVQQYAYHRLVSELKRRHYQVVDEEVLADQSVRVRIRL